MKRWLLVPILSLVAGIAVADDAVLAAIRAGDAAALETALEDEREPAESRQAAWLIATVQAAEAALLDQLLTAGVPVDARADDALRATATMYAAYADAPALLERLAAAGADLDQPDALGDPPINWAVYGGRRDAVRWLLDRGVRLDQVGHGNAVQIAKRRGFTDIVGWLCAEVGCNDRLAPGVTAAARLIDAGDAAGLAAIGPAGTVPSRLGEALDETGRPLLHRAARQGHRPVVEALLAMGTPVDLRDDIGFTALMEAARDGHVPVLELLLEAGANPRLTAEPSALSLTPIHLAAIGGDVAAVRRITAAGVDLDATDTDGSTPLLWALFEGRDDAVTALLELGADPTIANRHGYAPEAFLE